MIKFRYDRLYVLLALFAGFAIPTSTSLQNITLALICLVSIIDRQIRSSVIACLSNYFVLFSLILYLLCLLWAIPSQAPTADIWHMLLKMRVYLLAPLIIAYFNSSTFKRYAMYGYACGALVSLAVSFFMFALNRPLLSATSAQFIGGIGDWAAFRYHTYHNYFLSIMVIVLANMHIYYNHLLNNRQRIISWLIILLSVIDILYLVEGRAGQALFVVMIFMTLLLWQIKRGIIVSAIVIALLPIIYFSSATLQDGVARMRSDVSMYDKGQVATSIGYRIEFHKYAKELIARHPFIGYGTGSFHYEYQKFTGFTKDRATRHPHNDFYWLWIELGLFGALALLAMIISAGYYALKDIIRTKSPLAKVALMVVVTYAIGALQGGFFTDNISASAFMVLLAVLINWQKITLGSKHS